MSDRLSRASGRTVDWLEARLNLTEIFSFLTSFGLFTTDLDTRKPIRDALSEALGKPIPSYMRWPRVLGILTLLVFIFQCITGVLLAFYYRATSAAAYESVRTIIRDVDLGWFIHQMHYWGSNALIILLLLRLLRLFYDRLYKSPRELLWVFGFLLFIVATHSDFSGRTLTWERDNYWSTTRALELFVQIPFVGSFFSFLIGGAEVGDATLTRFYFSHVLLLPLAFFGLFYLHFLGIRRVGLLPEPGETAQSGLLAYKRYMLNLLLLITVVFGILVSLAVLFPEQFDAKADLLSTPSNALPPWYLLPAFGFFAMMPSSVPGFVKGAIVLLVLVGVCFLPVLDRAGPEEHRRRRLVLLLGAALVALILAFGIYGQTHA